MHLMFRLAESRTPNALRNRARVEHSSNLKKLASRAPVDALVRPPAAYLNSLPSSPSLHFRTSLALSPSLSDTPSTTLLSLRTSLLIPSLRKSFPPTDAMSLH